MPPPLPGPVCEMACAADAGAGWPILDGSGFQWPGFRWIVLQRHGRRPLAILGRTLLHADNRCAGLPWWSAITIHETSTSRFTACLCHTAPDDRGPPWRDAWVLHSPAAVRELFRDHDPLQAAPDTALAWQFRAAWAGLLGAVFGVPSAAGTASSPHA